MATPRRQRITAIEAQRLIIDGLEDDSDLDDDSSESSAQECDVSYQNHADESSDDNFDDMPDGDVPTADISQPLSHSVSPDISSRTNDCWQDVGENDVEPLQFNSHIIEIMYYSKASTTLSVGGIRHQFSVKENIELSLFASEFIRESSFYLSANGQYIIHKMHDGHEIDLQFQPNGYLYLATEKGAETLEKNHKLQSKLGAKIELMNQSKLKENFPWLNTDEIALGTHGLWGEGWLDPYSYLLAFKRKAISLGVRYIQAELVDTTFAKVKNMVDSSGKNFESCHSVQVKTADGITRTIKFSKVVLAAGCASGEVAKLFKIGTGNGILEHPLPVQPRKRFVHMFHTHDGPGLDCPFVINPNGMYFRREGLGGNYICGASPTEEEEPDPSNLDVNHEEFEEKMWPYLANQVPSFESLKYKSSWAGYYDYNVFDQNAIVGEHPYIQNLSFATGFSGHGIQQAAGIGRAVAEYIYDGKYQTIDLSRFHFNRVLDNEPIFESNII
ncbi:FAD-dependent oxidoreductase domain-containing protein 1 [Nymphon striatum]|nr:FAD-dependent oxidoreductase domain-containing protein 1 [Nymphon striatum]